MSGEGSLFERIRSADLREDLAAGRDPTLIARSICRNLERVFNNWRGSALIDPKLGMPDSAFAGVDPLKIAVHVAALLKENIISFEPRLKEVVVIPGADDPSEVYAWEFLIKARLVTAEGRPRAVFNVRRRRQRFEVGF